MITNPVRQFVTGNTERVFEYEGGTTLYHFSPYENGLSSIMNCNVVFFADNETHALDVLARMLQFMAEHCDQFAQYADSDPYRHDTGEQYRKKAERYAVWREAVLAGGVQLALAPTNQFYKVGWAASDTI